MASICRRYYHLISQVFVTQFMHFAGAYLRCRLTSDCMSKPSLLQFTARHSLLVLWSRCTHSLALHSIASYLLLILISFCSSLQTPHLAQPLVLYLNFHQTCSVVCSLLCTWRRCMTKKEYIRLFDATSYPTPTMVHPKRKFTSWYHVVSVRSPLFQLVAIEYVFTSVFLRVYHLFWLILAQKWLKSIERKCK